MPRFYAVAHGLRRGVYASWAECERNVKGVSQARYKGFSSMAEANAFLADNAAATTAPASNSAPSTSLAPPRTGPTTAVHPVTRSVQPRRVSPPLRRRSPPSPKVASQAPVTGPAATNTTGLTADGVQHVYVDGACTRNGQRGAKAGFGGYYGDADPRNFSVPLLATEAQTNNRGELRAIEHVLKSANTSGSTNPLVIHSDSAYGLKGIMEYTPRWKKNGWKTTGKKAVEHKDLFTSIAEEIAEYEARVGSGSVTLRHVKGHSNVYGNEMADRLAVKGANTPAPTPSLRPPQGTS